MKTLTPACGRADSLNSATGRLDERFPTSSSPVACSLPEQAPGDQRVHVRAETP
jgi:hypothetical protein